MPPSARKLPASASAPHRFLNTEGDGAREGIAYCESIQDYISRNLLKDILESEEEHIDWLETQLSLINLVGIENYLQKQMETAED